MNMKSGLWIDHRKAVIVNITENGADTKIISSNVEKAAGRTDGVRSTAPFEARQVLADDSQERKFTGRLDRYYDAVIHAIGPAEEIFIFGPGEAKGELKKRIESHHPTSRIVAVETVDKITDHQITAKVRDHFQRTVVAKSIGGMPDHKLLASTKL